MNEYVSELKEWLEKHANSAIALQQKAYMRNQFEFLGIKTPDRKLLLSNFIEKYGRPEREELKEIVQGLWHLQEREFQYIGIEILSHFMKKPHQEDIGLMEWMILEKSWWDTVDGIAGLVGKYFLKFPEKRDEYCLQWQQSQNIWLIRCSIIFQLMYRSKTDEQLLYTNILKNISQKEFFIQKGIGWALRQYSKTNPESVRSFIHEHPLSNLALREGMKWLKKQG